MSDAPPIFKKNMNQEETKKFMDYFKEKMELPGGITKGVIENHIGLVICMSCTIYFKWGWQEKKREAICKALEKYTELFGNNFNWVKAEDEPNKPLHQEYKKTRPLRKLYKKWGENTVVYRHYKGGDKIEDASPYSFLIMARPKWKADKIDKNNSNGVDLIRFSVPLSYTKEHLNKFISMVFELAHDVDALHGFAGYRTEISPDRYDDESTEALIAQRVNGIAVGSDFLATIDLSETKIKTISWLTIIGNKILPKEDYTWLRSELPPSWFALYPYPSGVVVQAGIQPMMASFDTDPLPPSYVLANMVFKPYRVEDCFIHHNIPTKPIIAGDSAVKAWLSRFDVPEDQLDAYKDKLTKTPRLKRKDVMIDAIAPQLQPLYK